MPEGRMTGNAEVRIATLERRLSGNYSLLRGWVSVPMLLCPETACP